MEENRSILDPFTSIKLLKIFIIR